MKRHPSTTTEIGGRIYIYAGGCITIHTYVAPDDALANSSHVIETPTCLLIVDAQYYTIYACDFRKYIDTLKKPIYGVLISHSHPDHYFGLSIAFPDVKSYALVQVREKIAATVEQFAIESRKVAGDRIPPKIMVPTDTIEPKGYDFGGLAVNVLEVDYAEDDFQMVLDMPSIDTLIVQDLCTNKIHPYLTVDLRNWLSILPQLPKRSLVLCGHGAPGKAKLITRTMRYLTIALDELERGPDRTQFKAHMTELYPSYQGVAIIDMYADQLGL